MPPMSFRICLTALTLLHGDLAIGSDLPHYVDTIESEGEYTAYDLGQHFSGKSLVIFIADIPSEIAEENYNEDRKLPLRSQHYSGVHSKVDNDEVGMPAASKIKNNSSNNATHGFQLTALKYSQRNKTEEKMQLLEDAAIKKRETDHERRVKEIVDHISVHYQSCIYLTYEARRIKRGGIVMDEFRKMMEDLAKPKYQALKAKALVCGKPVREPTPFVWQKPNTVVINQVKDSLNDGVY